MTFLSHVKLFDQELTVFAVLFYLEEGGPRAEAVAISVRHVASSVIRLNIFSLSLPFGCVIFLVLIKNR